MCAKYMHLNFEILLYKSRKYFMHFYSLQIELEVKDVLQENQLKSPASSVWECKD